ncbi:hypothetical protein [Lactococcus lactis]|uniref:hypothetical protein n=1 Tax=Lactococcus lactis TaxID=1358 RepID=UPI0021A41188|nr:hypothetical protein [Lactococcus lactis]MCT0052090.1 hypothetical protein [Lactococcus lactis subsp. lactis]
MHYIPKYSRERQNKRQSQKFVTVLDKKKLAKSLDENKLIATNLRVDTLKKVKLTGNKTKNNNFDVIYYFKDEKVNVPIAVSISNDLFNIMFPQKSFRDELKKEAPDGSDIFINIINVGTYLLKTNY